jgi:hypothetical protein
MTVCGKVRRGAQLGLGAKTQQEYGENIKTRSFIIANVHKILLRPRNKGECYGQNVTAECVAHLGPRGNAHKIYIGISEAKVQLRNLCANRRIILK